MSEMLHQYKNLSVDTHSPVLLFEEGEHRIYWLGIEEESAFRCNVYLIQDAKEFLLVDPGSRIYHAQLLKRVSKIVEPEKIGGIILCHQDPDVAASMVDWLEINPSMKVITSFRTNVLLPYYGNDTYDFFDIGENPVYTFGSGNTLKFVEAPFLHFPGAFTTLDMTSHFLFSGDIWAALDLDWKLVVGDFEEHVAAMNLFHLDYMASNVATRGFATRIEPERIDAILPQHGSIIEKNEVPNAIEYLKKIKCGLDIIYAADE